MKISIGFSRPKSKWAIVSGLIRLFQGGTEFSHTYLKFHFDKLERDMIFEAAHLSVHFQEYNNWKQDKIEVLDIPIEVDDERSKKIVRFCFDNCNKKYGLMTLICFPLHLIIGRDGDKSFICSELVADALDMNMDEFSTPKEIYEEAKRIYGLSTQS